jgi:hypothetical protein
MIIKIDLNSIKPNPYYLVKEYIPGKKTILFETTLPLPDYCIEDKNIVIAGWDYTDPVQVKGYIIDESLLNILIEKKPVNFSISIKRDLIDVTCFSTEAYLYTYIHKKVKCNTCKKSFMSNELQYDSDEIDDVCTNTDSKCPKCGKWDCCNIKYENINHALTRKK